MMKSCLLRLALLSVSIPVFAQSDESLSPRLLGPFPVDYSRKHDRDFRPSGGMTKLSEHLFLFEDTCNVYVVREGSSALLVGFGSGDILKKLPEIGVNSVDQVLVTHHHRNVVQGLCDLQNYPFQVAVPEAESGHFGEVEKFWRDVRLFINYDCRSHWNTIRKSVRVDRKLKPGDTVSWRSHKFEVLGTPGPTEHAISFAAGIDGRKVAFVGNLISASAKVPNWFDLHWDYYGFTQGMDASEKAFAAILATAPDLLLPSKGSPIANPAGAIASTRETFAVLRDMLVPNELHRVHQQVRQILPHLVFVGANCYAILSDSGRAFLWDYGYVDRARIDELKSRFKVEAIDAVSFSHYHDDHVIRTHELLRENTRIWAFTNMSDIFAHPVRYRLPCLIPFPITADRVLRDGEKVAWEEYSLEFFHLPGQTEFHQGLATTIDGKRVLFTGDNTWKKKHPEKARNGPLVPQNEYFMDGGFITCAQKMLDIMPDLVCPAHTEEYSPDRNDLEGFLGWARKLRDVMTSLIDQPDPNFGMDYRWCHFYPYRAAAVKGDRIQYEVRVRNHLFKPANVAIRLRLPDGIACSREARSITIPAKAQAAMPFELRAGHSSPARRVITADITINGRRVGEYAEALIDCK
jgi:glyoxylase-like metal-dependent hydrolase (beta-lactamase superfamily II)